MMLALLGEKNPYMLYLTYFVNANFKISKSSRRPLNFCELLEHVLSPSLTLKLCMISS